MVKNALTIDIEDLHHSRLKQSFLKDNSNTNSSVITKFVYEILDLLDQHSSKATFFILGSIAKRLPKLIKTIHERGHEVASHGYHHRLVYRLTHEEFRKDFLQSLKVLEDIIGSSVLGYRAPYWSITKSSLWALDIIKECGLKYDSSISPSVNFLYGIKGSPKQMYFHKAGIWEVPPTTINILGKVIIVGGGFYLRALPYLVTKKYFASLNKDGRFGIVYIHPHEFVNYRFEKKIPIKESFILNFRKHTLQAKFLNLLRGFKFTSIKSILRL